MKQTFASDLSVLITMEQTHSEQEFFETTEMAALAARFVNSTKAHVFLTGKAGTGKTTFLRQLAETTHKSYLILAPTGIAALNAKGVTLHSQFLLPFGSFIPERYLPEDIPQTGSFHDQNSMASKRPLDARRRKVLTQCELLIIDEVSMLRADVLDAVDYRMRAAKGRFQESFGGAQVLLIGDLFQLPPIVKDSEWTVLSKYYRSLHFFDARCLREGGFEKLELDKVFRQKDDNFLHILNNLRSNNLTESDIATLNRHYTPDAEIEEGVITLTTHNQQADSINEEKLRTLKGKEFRFKADVADDFPENMYPLPVELRLKEGAQVMFIKNDNTEKRFYNGMLAKVVVVDKEEIRVLVTGSEEVIKVTQHTWENKKYDVADGTKEIEETVVGQFSQFPLKLAWAITVHKSQGLTFDKAVIDVGRAFAPGQVYVALSRIRSLDGLRLRTRISQTAVSNDSKVVEFSRHNAGSAELTRTLAIRQQEFIRSLLADAFDFSVVSNQLNFIHRKYNAKMEFADAIMQQALPGITTSLNKEQHNTRVFRKQLQRLLQEDKQQELVDRLHKGIEYYADVFSAQMKELFQHQEEVAQLSKVKEYSSKLEELELMLVKQLSSIHKTLYVLGCILKDEPIRKNQQLADEVSKTIKELREQAVSFVKANRQFGKGKSGRKRKGKLVSAGMHAKESTYDETFRLHKSGLTIEEIAQKRDLRPTTIEGHLAKGIGSGEVEISTLLDANGLERIKTAFAEQDDNSLSRIHAGLKGKYSFGQLRMVKAYLMKSVNAEEK